MSVIQVGEIINQYCSQHYTQEGNMLGCINPNTIALLHSHLIVAFNSQHYVYSTTNQVCQACLDLGHEDKIICSTLLLGKDSHLLHSFDSSGLYIVAELESKSVKVNKINKYRVFGQKQRRKVVSAAFASQQCILFVDSDNKLQSYSIPNRALSHIAHQLAFSLILDSPSDPILFILHLNQQIISLYHRSTSKIQGQYQHSARITSAISVGNMLVIGDEHGKITLLYNYFSSSNANNQLSSVLEWHTGPVTALSSSGRYIYSAGHESVIVMWHTKDLSRDFLPRVGTAIKSLLINSETNEIICSQSDNSIKVIDLSRDKQIVTYKALIDPKGYAPVPGPRFSPFVTSATNGTVCLASLPGKLQFLNLSKNLETSEVQIIGRNLISNIDGDKIQPHRINSFVFSEDQSIMVVSILAGSSKSQLKFYRKAVQGYELINKVQNPHVGPIQYCSLITTKKGSKFVTFSQQDNTLRVWSEHKEKKKSIIDTTEVYWKCSQELKYRNLPPQSVSCLKNFMVAVFGRGSVVFYEASEEGWIGQVENIQEVDIKQVKLIDSDYKKQSKKMKILIVRNSLQFQVWSYSKGKTQQFQMSIEQKLQPKQKITSYFVLTGIRSTLISLQTNKLSQLAILDNKTGRLTESYDLDTAVQTAFWLGERLILLGPELTMFALDGQPFVVFHAPQQKQTGDMMEEQETEVRDGEVSILKLSERWVERESIKSKSKVEDCTSGLDGYPDCTSIWEEMASRMLL